LWSKAAVQLGSITIHGGSAADGLGLLRVWETYISATVGVGLALAYAAIVTFAVPVARSTYSPLYLALAIFCINGLGFGIAALTPLSPRYAGIKRFYEQHARRNVTIDMQLTTASLTFLWLAVVGVI
jgi:hypothetical protein